MTGEPFQPIRLYYSLPRRADITRVLLGLRCMAESDPSGWLWHYEEEAGSLKFPKSRQELPAEVHPIILGCFRFPSKDRAVLEVRSADRAVAAARFFGPLFGPKVILRRVRILNRFVEASEAAHGIESLEKLLDQNVVRIDSAKAEAEIGAVMSTGQTDGEKQKAFLAYHEERRKQDVPLVEDFPLDPEEETNDFRHLAATLQFRGLRAYEHGNGNTHLTLTDVIHLVVERGGRGLSTGPQT